MKQKPSSSNTLITKLVLLICIMLLLTLYFWGHNVGQSALNLANGFTTIFRAGLNVFTVAVLVTIAGGIGRRIFGRIVPTNSLILAEKVALDAAIGLGGISIGALLLGLIGLYNAFLWVVLIAVGIINFAHTTRWLLDCVAVIKRAFNVETGWQRFIVTFAAGLLIAALLIALAPPVAWDAMTYHLEGAQRYVQAGRIAAQPDNFFFGFPQGVEVLYGLLMTNPLTTDSAPALLHFTFGLFGLMATGGLTRCFSSANTAYTSVLLLMSSYSIWLLFGWAYVDLAMLCYGSLALITISQWSAEKTPYWLILTGVIAGYALGVKYTAASLIVALAVFILIREPKQVIRNGLIFGLSLFVVFLPWLIKGWLLYQNPVYPYIFDGLNWDSLRAANFGSSGNGLLSGNLWWHLPILPFTATIRGVESYAPYSFTTGVWLLTLPFALIFGWKVLEDVSRTLAKTLLPIALVLLVFWMVLAATSGIGAQPRLMLVGMPVAAILGALGLHSIARLPRKPLDIYFIIQAVIIFSVLMGLFDVVHEFAKTRVLDYTAGTISKDQYLLNNLGNHYAMMQQLDELPTDATMLFLFEPGTYYCPDDIVCVPDVLFDNWSRPILQGTSPDALMQQWRDAGVDYVLLFDSRISPDATDRYGYEFWLGQHKDYYDANVQLPEMIDAYLTPVWDDGLAYRLYTWKD